jgi:glucokinase
MGLYGEHQLGAAVGARNVLGVFLGTGIGGAMIIDGKLHLGTGGVAGDIGHYLVQPFGPLGGSERQGVLDDFASRTAIAATAAAYASKQWAPHLLEMAGTDLANMRSHTLAKAISKGDKPIEDLIRSRARIVGIVLSNLIDFINPDMVVLGGGLVEKMTHLIHKEVEAGIRDHTTPEALEGFKVVTSKLLGQAVATGAAKMAWDRYIEKKKAGGNRLTKKQSYLNLASASVNKR